MKRVGIVTINDNLNCGNRLQNYALQETIKSMGLDAITIKNDALLNSKNEIIINSLKYIKKILISNKKTKKSIRDNFSKFNDLIKLSKNTITCFSKNIKKDYDYFVVGSDQVWKPTRKRLSDIDLLTFANNSQKISYAASFGVSTIDDIYKKKLKCELPKFKAISVRENEGKTIIEEATEIKNVEVVLDPTMLLDKNEWRKIQINTKKMPKKYALCYFLGNENVSDIIEFCEKNELEVLVYNKKNQNFGPFEFLTLIDNAELIFTDSFHGSVFSILFEKEFYVLERKEKDLKNNMISRIDTLLGTFKLENRKINRIKNLERFKCNYCDVNLILEQEREKSKNFLKKALDIKD